MKKSKKSAKKKDLAVRSSLDYDKAMLDPFAFMNSFRGGGEVDDFDIDSLNKGAHSVTSSFIETEMDIAHTVRDIIDTKSLVPRDLKIDDGDMPEAKNLYEWVSREKFSMINGEKPFIEQLSWGVISFTEYCWRCTDTEYLFVDHAVDDTYSKFERKVAMYEHGTCPHCGMRRSQAINKKKQDFIQSLAVCAGQRSGKTLTVAGYFAPYLTHKLLKLQNPSAYYGLKTGTMLHMTFVALTYAQAKDTLWQNYYATLTESKWFCIAEGQRVTLSDGSSKPIESIAVGDEVATLEGYAPVTRTKCTGTNDCLTIALHSGNSLTATNDHKVRCLSSDGMSLVWKRMDELTEDDFVVIDDENPTEV
jgi:hypothetical protein